LVGCRGGMAAIHGGFLQGRGPRGKRWG
jgi:hypothetical protein